MIITTQLSSQRHHYGSLCCRLPCIELETPFEYYLEQEPQNLPYTEHILW